MASHTSRPMQSRLRTVQRACVFLGVLFVAALCGIAPAAAATHHVTVASYAYSPNPLSITAGDTVTWTNSDDVGHDVTVTSGPASFQSPLLSKGQSWSYTFATPGTYSYICSVHPDMKASVVVAPAAAPARAVQTPNSTTHQAMRMQVVTVPAHSPMQATKQAAAPRPTTVATVAGSSMPDQPTINPLLLVAGACLGVVVFCLLLLGSRPHRAQPDTE